MADKTKGGTPTPRTGKPYREPPTIDLAPSDVVEETAPVATHPATAASRPDAPTAEPSSPNPSSPNRSSPSPSPNVAPTGAAGSTTAAAPMAERTTSPTDAGRSTGQATPEPAATSRSAGHVPPVGDGARAGGPASPTPTAAPPQSRRHLGVLGLAVAAIAGGLAGVAGALAVVFALSSPSDVAARYAALESRVDQRLAATAPKADVEQLRQRVTGLTGTVSDLTGNVAKLGTDVTSARERLQALNDAQSAAPAASASPPAEAAAPVATADPALLDRLRERLDTLDQRTTAVADLAPQVQQLRAAVTDLDAGVGKTANEAMAKVDALGNRISSVEDRSTDARVAALTRALAARSLISAIDNGKPFKTELAALTAAGPQDAAALKPLQATAADGVATTAALRQEFEGLADRINAAAVKDEGFVQRLAASASRVVRIQRIDGDGKAGTTAGGSVDTVEAALARGDTAAALAAWQALPPAAQQIAPTFGNRLSARAAAESAAGAIQAGALAALAAQPAAPSATPAEGRAR